MSWGQRRVCNRYRIPPSKRLHIACLTAATYGLFRQNGIVSEASCRLCRQRAAAGTEPGVHRQECQRSLKQGNVVETGSGGDQYEDWKSYF